MLLLFPPAATIPFQPSTFPDIPGGANCHGSKEAHTIMEREEHTEEEIILVFTVSDEALEQAADSDFSLGNYTDARTCPMSA
jgi:hypothetical protein